MTTASAPPTTPTTETCRQTAGPGADPTATDLAAVLPCRAAHDADLWFAESPTELEQAKALCTDCPVRSRCLELALDRAEPWGVWGGEILDHGVVIARKRPRGRPRKTAA